MAAGIIALEPAFATGAAIGVVLVAIGLAVSFFAAEQWGLLGTATTLIGALLLAGGVIGFTEADFAGLLGERLSIHNRLCCHPGKAASRTPH